MAGIFAWISASVPIALYPLIYTAPLLPVQLATWIALHLIFGLIFDETMSEAVRMTVIATGINSEKPEQQQSSNVVTKLPTAVANDSNGVDDEFEIPAFIRKRNIGERV